MKAKILQSDVFSGLSRSKVDVDKRRHEHRRLSCPSPPLRMSSRPNTANKTLAVVTGASRGIGRAIALSLTKKAINSTCDVPSHPSSLQLVLIARSGEYLSETARLVQEMQNKENDETSIVVDIHEMDLSDLDILAVNMKLLFEFYTKVTKYNQCWLFNNAGSLGPLGPTLSLCNGDPLRLMQDLKKAVDLNVTSATWISSQFVSTFGSSHKDDTPPLVRIVNISSLCAIEPFQTMAVYCMGKAARDMYHLVLAKEHKDSDTMKVLNYAPGPCDTEMTDVLAGSAVLDWDLHQYYATSKRDQKLVDPLDSAKKLIELLEKDEFTTGSHVDYFDV